MDSRELDALIAEKVMGLTLAVSDKAWSDEDWLGSDYPTKSNVLAIVTDAERGSLVPMRRVIPPYSTDIAAAWLVVERMRGDFMLDLQDHIVYWSADFLRSRPGGIKQVAFQAPSAPLAICLAALKAVGALHESGSAKSLEKSQDPLGGGAV